MRTLKTWIKDAVEWEEPTIIEGARKLPQTYLVIESETDSDKESRTFDKLWDKFHLTDIVKPQADSSGGHPTGLFVSDGVIKVADGIFMAGEMTWVLFVDPKLVG